ncbi:MAG: hypothetical protein AAGD38_09395 [Acidobacteriota bacterium]
MPRIAYVVSSHGFGHATRSNAVMAALLAVRPDLDLDIVTTTPRWVFDDSLRRPIHHHAIETDVGMVQQSALVEDLTASIETIAGFVRALPARAATLASYLGSLGTDLVVADISPLGLAAGRHAGLPTVLVESFTWSWIYRHYRTGDAAIDAALGRLGDSLAPHFATVDLHIQTTPVCEASPDAVTTSPVARQPLHTRAQTRNRLGIPTDEPMILVTMGGIPWRFRDSENVRNNGPWLVIPGGSESSFEVVGKTILFPHRSDFHHPDLIHAADAVFGKLGYSTVAEVWRAGVPFGYIPRPAFPESPLLEAWVREHLSCRPVDAEHLDSDAWIDHATALLDLPRQTPPEQDGAQEVAAAVLGHIDRL